MPFRYYRAISVALFFFVVCFNSANAATLTGLVVDAETKEPLSGARVAIVGTRLGAIAGLDGSFTITGLNAGTVTAKVSSGGYKDLSVAVEINSSDATVNQEFALKQITYHGSETLVVGRADNGSDISAQKLVQNSDEVVNAVSARTIEVSPDLSVADVSQRVSGVTTTRTSNGDGQYAIIRGMDKRYNYTTVNGIKIPSPDNKNRYVPLDIFPSELLDRLEVTKSLLPTMEGDAIGGAMNLVMKQAPEREIASIKVASGYDGLYFSRKFYGVNFNSASQSPRVANGLAYNATLNDFPISNFNPTSTTPGPNQLYGATYGNRFFEDKSFGVIASATYQNTFRGANTYFFPTTADQATSLPTVTDLDFRQYSTAQSRLGAMANFDYRASETSTFELSGMYADLRSQELRDEFDSILGLSWPQTIRVPYTRRLTVQDQGIANATLRGNQEIFGKDLEVKWAIAYSRASLNQPDRTVLDLYGGTDLNSSGVYVAEPYNVNNGNSRRWSSNVDQDKSAYLTLTTTESLFGLSTEFQYGGMYRMKVRSSLYDAYELRPNNTNSIQRWNGSVASDTFTVFNPRGTSDDPLNYDAHENVAAGFLQAKFQIGQLLVVGGARVENTDFGWESQAPVTFEGKTGTIQYIDILPSVSLKYMPTTDQNYRLSYFKSISRPGFFEVIPNNGVPGDDYTETTNPFLNRTQASNIDARWEYFPGGLDQLLIGAFYKNIQDPIEYSVVEVKTNTFLEPQNWGTATNFGFEIDLKKFFSNFGVQANYTFTSSSITTDKKVDFRSTDPNVGLTFRTEKQTRPLQGQAAHIGNLSLLYKNFEIGTDAQLGLVYTGPNIVSVSPFKDNDVWQKQIIQLDFSGEQTIYQNLAVFVKINNILNTPREEVIHQPFTALGPTPVSFQTPGQDILVRREYYDRTYLIGFRYKL